MDKSLESKLDYEEDYEEVIVGNNNILKKFFSITLISVIISIGGIFAYDNLSSKSTFSNSSKKTNYKYDPKLCGDTPTMHYCSNPTHYVYVGTNYKSAKK